MRQRATLHERVLARVEQTPTDCWEWTGYRMKNGYGTIGVSHGGGTKLTHRVVYEALVGPVPEGTELDHLCRNRACVNPNHLEAVTRHINIVRGQGPAATKERAARRAHCRHGHPWDDSNTHISPQGRRVCRACKREAAKRQRARRRSAT
jgi:HNH endonuclease